MSPTTESDVLERQVTELTAEGYEVYLHPKSNLVPRFLGDYRPDIVARRDDKGVVVEVATRAAPAEKRLQDIRKLFDNQQKWTLRILWLEEAGEQPQLQPMSAAVIRSSIEELKRLARDRHNAAAVLMGWSVLEAIGRAVLPSHLARPQTPRRLVTVLAEGGDVTPTEADRLRGIALLRNRLVHGGLAEGVSDIQVREFVAILENLLSELEPTFA